MSSLESSLRRGAQRFVLLALHYRYALVLIAASYALLSLFFFVIYRIATILNRARPERKIAQDAGNDKRRKGYLLVVLGSGGHTSEMLSILQNLGAKYLESRFDRRTWLVSSGDAFSAERARRFEEWIAGETSSKCQWDIVTVRRAREIHQPLYTAPISCLQCLWDCTQVLQGTYRDAKDNRSSTTQTPGDPRANAYPDLILTNGPATAVILVLASLILMFLGLAPINPGTDEGGAMRSVYIESWARVRTLSLSGKMMRLMAGRFLVQWRGLEDVDLTKVNQSPDEQNAGVVAGAKENGKSRMLRSKIEYVGAVVT